jgi:hypothetical protein
MPDSLSSVGQKLEQAGIHIQICFHLFQPAARSLYAGDRCVCALKARGMIPAAGENVCDDAAPIRILGRRVSQDLDQGER